jgi:hypothetical protein
LDQKEGRIGYLLKLLKNILQCQRNRLRKIRKREPFWKAAGRGLFSLEPVMKLGVS